jgi:hypothetical protein
MMKRRIIQLLSLPLLCAAIPAVAAPKDVEFKTEGKGYSYRFAYPSVIARFPKLKAGVEKNRSDTLAEIKNDAKSWLEDSSYRDNTVNLDRQIDWAQVANLPGYLSLTADDYRYDGGAHGNFGRRSTIWDKALSLQIAPIDMFTSKAAFDRLVQTEFCDKLDAERTLKREGEKVDRSQSGDWTQACPSPSDLVVILGSSDGKKFNRMAVYAAPYAAGPYVEGDYEINLPITAKLISIVKPEYKAAFAVKRK